MRKERLLSHLRVYNLGQIFNLKASSAGDAFQYGRNEEFFY